MPFINSFSINADKQNPFPFNIPAVRFAKQVKLDSRVTIFVGDNGSGKSTLLESIAFYLKTPLIGGHIPPSASFEAARLTESNHMRNVVFAINISLGGCCNQSRLPAVWN